jgi:23S rRNA (pseudouridine1915-N3)-methyltransferase
MNLVFISVGKKHEEMYREAIDDYTKRISHSCPVEWQFIPNQIENEKDKRKGMEKEGELIISKLQSQDRIILLDEGGKEWTTIGLAEMLGEMQGNGVKRLVFIIGGAYGVSAEVKNRAQYSWALSKLTFPHMLARLILAESVYRAFSILSGSKYHHS